ncbi:DUF1413 domain-containing protein [Staphylococcus xylosus]
MVTLDEVIKRAEKKKPKETFEIKDLFTDQEWKGAKNVTGIGKDFYDAVDNKKVKGVDYKCTKTNNHKVYERK